MSVERALMMAGSKVISIESDPYFKQTTLLLHADGTNGAQNNTFIDSSTNNFTITRNGNTTQGTFTPFSQAAGYWGNYFDGSSSLASSANQVIPTGSYTIEAWVFVTSTTSSQSVIAQGMNSSDAGRTSLWIDTGVWSAKIGGTDARSTIAPVLNTWTHVAMTYNGSTITLWVNGVSAATASITQNASNSNLWIGTNWNIVNFNGYISNVRISNSVIYSATFTPSTTPYLAAAGVVFLSCQSNRLIDNSSNAYALTTSGTPSVQPFSPFAPTAAYSTTVNGGSGYFDGTGDYLVSASSANLTMGTGDFTLEFWLYPTSKPSAGTWWNTVSLGDGTWNGANRLTPLLSADFSFLRTSANAGQTTDFYFGNAPILVLQWNHVVIQRSGTTITAYANGKACTAGSIAGSVSLASTVVTAGTGSETAFSGYISNIRVLKGSAQYSGSTYTVPAAPLTAITNTQLLLSCTNAGIYDNAIKNDLETVGNAQISTSVKKYGTGSIYLDGTGDYLVAANSQGFNFGTGDFTVEMWVYVIANQANATLIDTTSGGGGTTGWFLEYSATRGMYFYIGNSTSISYATTPTLSTWTHLAVARSSGTCKLFINGTQVASSSLTTSASSTYPMYVGGVSPGGLVPFYGYIDDLRITKGVARYTATFTPPTSAFPNQ